MFSLLERFFVSKFLHCIEDDFSKNCFIVKCKCKIVKIKKDFTIINFDTAKSYICKKADLDTLKSCDYLCVKASSVFFFEITRFNHPFIDVKINPKNLNIDEIKQLEENYKDNIKKIRGESFDKFFESKNLLQTIIMSKKFTIPLELKRSMVSSLFNKTQIRYVLNIIFDDASHLAHDYRLNRFFKLMLLSYFKNIRTCKEIAQHSDYLKINPTNIEQIEPSMINPSIITCDEFNKLLTY